MEGNAFVEILRRYVTPMFSGASLGEIEPKGKQRKLVSLKPGGQTILLTPSLDSEYCAPLKRNRQFEVVEREFLEQILKELGNVVRQIQAAPSYTNDLMNAVIRRSIVAVVADDSAAKAVENAIKQLESFASQT